MKGILFNTEMVRAILDGKKTTTRRPIDSIYQGKKLVDISFDLGFPASHGYTWAGFDEPEDPIYCKGQYVPGDILYVRETWKTISAEPYDHEILIHYIADDFEQYVKFLPVQRYFQFEKYLKKNGDHPNIFMPKEAARIFLRVTDVRVQRIQKITPAECRAEGIEDTEIYNEMLEHCSVIGAGTGTLYIQAYANLWNEIYAQPKPVYRHGEIDHYTSYSGENIQETREYRGKKWIVIGNPWVWIIEFERCEKPDEN